MAVVELTVDTRYTQAQIEALTNQSILSTFQASDDATKIYKVGTDGLPYLYMPKSWNYYADNINYTAESTLPTGRVLTGTIDGATVYRFVSTAFTGPSRTLDGFYEDFDGITVSQLITTRG